MFSDLLTLRTAYAGVLVHKVRSVLNEGAVVTWAATLELVAAESSANTGECSEPKKKLAMLLGRSTETLERMRLSWSVALPRPTTRSAVYELKHVRWYVVGLQRTQSAKNYRGLHLSHVPPPTRVQEKSVAGRNCVGVWWVC